MKLWKKNLIMFCTLLLHNQLRFFRRIFPPLWQVAFTFIIFLFTSQIQKLKLFFKGISKKTYVLLILILLLAGYLRIFLYPHYHSLYLDDLSLSVLLIKIFQKLERNEFEELQKDKRRTTGKKQTTKIR